jgi:hypothetical protein
MQFMALVVIFCVRVVNKLEKQYRSSRRINVMFTVAKQQFIRN